MITLFLSYAVDDSEALEIVGRFDALLFKLGLVKSREEILLADFLAKKFTAEGKSIARKFKYEFLLWLTGKKDIRSAFECSAPSGGKALLILFDASKKKSLMAALGAKILKNNLERAKRAQPLDLERISLSRTLS